MRFEAEYAPLMDAIRFASSAVKRSYIPVLDCLNISAGDARVTIAGTDMDSRAVAKCAAAVQDGGEINVDASRLAGFLSASKGDLIGFESDGETVRVRCGRSSATFSVNPDPFPTFGKPEDEIEIPGGINALVDCAPFAKDGARLMMGGVAFSRGYAIGADGPQIAAKKLAVTPDESVMVPLVAIPLARKCGGRLFLSDRTWRAEADGRAVIGKTLADHKLARVEMMAAATTPLGDVDPAEISAALDALSGAGASVVILSRGPDGTTLEGENFDGAAREARVPISMAGGPAFSAVIKIPLLKLHMAFFSEPVSLFAGNAGNGFLLMRLGDDSTALGLWGHERNALPAMESAA